MRTKRITQRRWRHLTPRIAIVCGGIAYAFNGDALALSLGPAELTSFLAEPLRVRVPLELDPGDTGIEPYQVSLLPAGAYAERKLPPPPLDPRNYRITVNGSPERGRWIEISSLAPIREPILSLLLEIRSPATRMVRSIDLLLDPPRHGIPRTSAKQAPPPSSNLPTTTRPDYPRSKLPVMSYQTGRTPIAHLMREKTAPIQNGITHMYGPVRPGESLSRIADRARLDPATPLPQLIQAIYTQNPTSFNGHPDQLKIGSMLAIPDMTAGSKVRGLPTPPVRVQITTAPAAKMIAAPSTQEAVDTPRELASTPVVEARRYMQGTRLALDLRLSARRPEATPSRALPIAISNDKARHVTTTAADTVTQPSQDTIPFSLRAWSWWLLTLGLTLAVWAARKLGGARTPNSLAQALHLSGPTARHVNRPLPSQPASPDRAAEDSPALATPAETESEPDSITRLHLRLTGLLARDSSEAMRKQARRALSHLEAGQTEAARALIDTMDLQLQPPAEATQSPKVVALQR